MLRLATHGGRDDEKDELTDTDTRMQTVLKQALPTFTVLSKAPEKMRPLDTARQATEPWCRTRVCVQIMLSMLHTCS